MLQAAGIVKKDCHRDTESQRKKRMREKRSRRRKKYKTKKFNAEDAEIVESAGQDANFRRFVSLFSESTVALWQIFPPLLG